MLLDKNHNRGLPSCLIDNPGGKNSGYMIAQYTAAALVSENKVLSHPASVDSIPTSANAEDHVSMGTTAARKARKVVENVKHVLSIELLCATEALTYRQGEQAAEVFDGPTGRAGRGTRKVYEAAKANKIVAFFQGKDRIYTSLMENARRLLDKTPVERFL